MNVITNYSNFAIRWVFDSKIIQQNKEDFVPDVVSIE